MDLSTYPPSSPTSPEPQSWVLGPGYKRGTPRDLTTIMFSTPHTIVPVHLDEQTHLVPSKPLNAAVVS